MIILYSQAFARQLQAEEDAHAQQVYEQQRQQRMQEGQQRQQQNQSQSQSNNQRPLPGAADRFDIDALGGKPRKERKKDCIIM